MHGIGWQSDITYGCVKSQASVIIDDWRQRGQDLRADIF